MKSFKDMSGRTWSIAITVGSLRRVRGLCDIDLTDAISDHGKLIDRLSSDPILLCDVIFAICKPEADKLSISDEDFGAAMAGDAIEHATAALLDDLVDFFPGPKRAVLHRAMQKLKTYQNKALELVALKLDDPAMDKQFETSVKEAIGMTAPTNAPESSE